MKKTIITCDHCGKELDEMKDYVDMEIDDFINWYEVDLCDECFHELDGIVRQYVNKESI